MLQGTLAAGAALAGSLAPGGRSYPIYSGETEVTPSDSVQILPTEGKAVVSDITINPIPSNYGLITYSGSIITVS